MSDIFREMQNWLASQSADEFTDGCDVSWYWVPDSLTRISSRSFSSTHPCFRIAKSNDGTTRIYIRSSTRFGNYPDVLVHTPHSHVSRDCGLNLDGYVSALDSKLISTKKIDELKIFCNYEDEVWLKAFQICLKEIERRVADER